MLMSLMVSRLICSGDRDGSQHRNFGGGLMAPSEFFWTHGLSVVAGSLYYNKTNSSAL